MGMGFDNRTDAFGFNESLVGGLTEGRGAPTAERQNGPVARVGGGCVGYSLACRSDAFDFNAALGVGGGGEGGGGGWKNNTGRGGVGVAAL